VIPKSTFDDVAVAHSPLSPCATRKDWLVYSRRKKGKGKLINEVSSCSSSLLGCGGANEGAAFSLARAKVDGLNGPPSAHYERAEVVGEGSSWVLDPIIFFSKRMGLVIGGEMELLSFLASLESFSTKSNQFVDDRGKDQEEGERLLIDGDMC